MAKRIRVFPDTPDLLHAGSIEKARRAAHRTDQLADQLEREGRTVQAEAVRFQAAALREAAGFADRWTPISIHPIPAILVGVQKFQQRLHDAGALGLPAEALEDVRAAISDLARLRTGGAVDEFRRLAEKRRKKLGHAFL